MGAGKERSFSNLHSPSQLTKTGIEIKREGTQCHFHLTSRVSSFGLRHHLPTLHLDSPGGNRRHFKPLKRTHKIALEIELAF